MNSETALLDPQLRALLSLIDDESPTVRETCRERARSYGTPCLPLLREQIGGTTRPLLRRASLALARVIRLDENLEELRGLIRGERPLLEEGCITIAQIANPLLEREKITATLDEWADRLRPSIGPSCSLLRAADRLRSFANETLGLRGNETNYVDPRNSLLDQVIERRTGIPITLSALWLLVARRLGVPFHGLGIPSHFLIGFHHEGTQHFIDPFHGGRILEHVEVTAIIKANHLPLHPAYFRPVRDVDMIFRMTNNLVAILEGNDAHQWLESIQRLRRLITDEERV